MRFRLRNILIFIFFSPPVTWLTRGAAWLIGLVWNEADLLDISQQTVMLPRLHPAFDGYRLTQISDIHMDYAMPVERLADLVDQTNATQPDLIVITGDFVSHYSDERYLAPLRTHLARLHATDGVFAVMGNHDHVDNIDHVRALLREVGIIELQNTVRTLRRGAAVLHLAGVDDPYYEHDDLPAVLAALPPDGAAILLAHVPDYADLAATAGRFDLQLSGHSHAGQIGLRWLWPIVLPHMSKKYPIGRYEVNGMTLYTNRGVGSVHIPLRINAIPEITVFRLEVSR